jgi:hypothetical protein
MEEHECPDYHHHHGDDIKTSSLHQIKDPLYLEESQSMTRKGILSSTKILTIQNVSISLRNELPHAFNTAKMLSKKSNSNHCNTKSNNF